MTDILTLPRPDDWHIHLRDGPALARTVPDAARQFARVLCMPNLLPPVLTTEQASAYRQRILAHVPTNTTFDPRPAFDPRMVLYLTDKMASNEVRRAKASGIVNAVKLYPAGATTNSDAGVTDISKVYAVLAAMEEEGLVFCVHGEVTHSDIDIFDREKRFIDEVLQPLTQRFPSLKIVFEHITTKEAAEFVQAAGTTVAATITAHHLLFNRNHMLVGGIRPHYFCLPILKRREHQQALIAAAGSGSAKFFLGTDSAPHAKSKKEAACGCAGSYTAPIALELYAQAFDDAGALDKLANFASGFGADFYGLPRHTETVTLRRSNTTVPTQLPYLDENIVPLCAGETLRWTRQ